MLKMMVRISINLFKSAIMTQVLIFIISYQYSERTSLSDAPLQLGFEVRANVTLTNQRKTFLFSRTIKKSCMSKSERG